jgi:Domain of unknown function (DUF4386)
MSMSTAVMMERIREVSPRLKAQIAGVVFSLAMLTAAFMQFFVHRRLSFAADLVTGIIEVSGMLAVTLLFYDIFKAVKQETLFARAVFQFRGTHIRASSIQSAERDDRHRISRTLLLPDGYLLFRSTFLPRILGAPMAFAGLGWLVFLSPTLTHFLSPYNLAVGMLGEASVCLWLLVMGVNVQRWKEQAGA